MTFQAFNISPWLTPVRLAATSNQSGTYFNGPLNNGVGATFTYATGALTIDSVTVNVGDRILFSAQTAANENGIYVCTQAGATGVSAILQRSSDQQCIEQMHVGFYVTVGAGTANGGTAHVMVEPLPAQLGISDLLWASTVTAGAVSFSGGASTANALAVFSDAAGNIKAQTTTSTLGFGLTLATGNLTATTGNLIAGSSGNAGTVTSFPATAANGSLILSALNAGGAFNTTIRNSVMGQSSVISIPDPGAATANFLLDTGASNILSMQEFVGLSEVLTFGTGTWTTTRIAQGNYVSRHTPGDETSVIAVDITPQIRVAASKGFRLDSFDYIYAIAANALDAHSAVLDRIAYADNVAVSVTSIPITATLATATQANPYLTNCTVTTPAFDVTADSKYVLEITVNNAAASEYDYYGIMLRFSQTIG